MKRFKSWTAAAVLIGVTVVAAMTIHSPTIREISVVGWVAANVDVSVGYIDGVQGAAFSGNFTRDTILFPYRVNYYGWEKNGPVFPIKEPPEFLLVSWRLTPTDETPFEKCARSRLNNDCGSLGGAAQGSRYLETGQLVGPFKVPVNLSPKAKALINRSGSFHRLTIGVSYGLTPPKLRWILYGDPENGKVDIPALNELARGGDW